MKESAKMDSTVEFDILWKHVPPYKILRMRIIYDKRVLKNNC